MCHTTRHNYPQCGSLLQTESLDKNVTYTFQSCGDICPQLDVYKKKTRRLDVGFSPHKRWFSCQRMRLLVDKKTKKKSSSIHETSPPDHYSKGASDCSVNDSPYQLGQTSQKGKRQEYVSS